ncbi:hypothetical protein E1263_31305 [Kribbella antibiotica]|uniref:Uncharacterized protein n=1 Tax=Kribbella antibiotica TaxID=190195 RepID=A0A4R4YX51_9ACTN|nr:hypothetical protein [Kribbella antibiotica]TDD50058.1 hypothetical protein E1263_31305 [Kribbella antibiotica]
MPTAEAPLPPERSGAAFQAVWTVHGNSLRALAATILRNSGAAEMVVVDVISTRCIGPGGIVRLPSRHELARLTYLRCLRAGAIDDRIKGRPERDRPDSNAAIALVEFGDHSSHQVSELLDLSHEATAKMLAAGQRDTSPAVPTSQDSGPGVQELLAMLKEQWAHANP